MDWLLYILLALLAFYILAPLPYLLDELYRWGWDTLCCTYKYDQRRRWWWYLRHFVYYWYLWPFYRAPPGQRSDWGPWYHVTLSWWRATYRVWRNPPRCNFCARVALGVFPYQFGPWCFTVCEEHAQQLVTPVEELLPFYEES